MFGRLHLNVWISILCQQNSFTQMFPNEDTRILGNTEMDEFIWIHGAAALPLLPFLSEMILFYCTGISYLNIHV